MTSKEALEGIEQYILNNKGRLCFFIKLYLGTIKQDLERLEMLEKENKELWKNIEKYNHKFAEVERKKCDLMQENEKLKKAIEIITSKDVCVVYNEIYIPRTKLTQQEYDLLKEVLGNA